MSEAWHPDVVSLDRQPPQPFSLAFVPPLHHERITFELPEFVDAGGAGMWGYEWSWQRYPSGPWEESLVGQGGGWLQHETEAGVATRVRLRAWDAAGNATRWEYSPPLTVFENELLSRVVDNRALGVPDVVIETTPSSFLELDDGEGEYHHYTAEAVIYGTPGTISWSHSGFTSPAPRSFSVWVDRGLFEFDVVLPPTDNVISNGGFDTGNLSGWDSVGPVSVQDEYASFSGTDAMVLSQTVTIPSGAMNATLAFRYLYNNSSATALAFTVDLIGDGGTPTTLATMTTNTDWQFVHTWVDVSAWAGESVTVRFRLGAGGGSQAALDDVSLGSAYPDVWVNALGEPAAWRGQTATLRLAYGNRSSLEAPDAALTWALPANLTLVEATPAPTGTAPLHWELGTLAPGAEGSIEVVVTVKPAAMGGLASAPAMISTPHEAITGNNSTPLGVWVGGKVYLPGVRRD